jgi:hypothetical protein
VIVKKMIILVIAVMLNFGRAKEGYRRLLEDHPESIHSCWGKERLNRLLEGKFIINKEGRAQFIVGSTLFGSWAGLSLANIIALGDDRISETDGKGFVWSAIGGAAAGLIPSLLLTSDTPMSTGRATMVNFSWVWGAWLCFLDNAQGGSI